MATTTQTPQPPAASTALTPLQKRFVTMKQMLEHQGISKQIEMALPRAIDPQRFLRIALTTLRSNPALLQCSPESVVGAIIQAAQLGLEVDPFLGQAYLIPYRNGDQQECQLQPGYRGYIKLSRNSGEIRSLAAHIVHEGEAFEYEQGTEKYLRHRPSDEFEENKISHVYAVVEYTNGGVDFEVMTHAGVEKVRTKSKAPNSPAWRESWGEMAKAKVIRRLSKRLPVNAENSSLVKAAVLDEMSDAGISQNNSAVIESTVDGTPALAIPQQALGHNQPLADKAANGLAGIKSRQQNGQGTADPSQAPRAEIPPSAPEPVQADDSWPEEDQGVPLSFRNGGDK